MNSNIAINMEKCYQLAEEGLERAFEDIGNSENREADLQSIGRAAHRIGVNVGFQYAEDFYQKGNKSDAREWLIHARVHAEPIGLDVKKKISEIKGKYKDRIPLFLTSISNYFSLIR